ncbi:MAG: IclR family transcriptional regulator [Alphaproteobacteria bacterium]
MSETENRRKGVQSIEIGAGLLEALTEFSGPATLKEISIRGGLSASKSHRYLVSLVRSGLVVQEPDTGRYDLGPMALRLGLSALRRLDVMRLAAEALPILKEKTGLTVLLTVWSDNGPTVIRIIEAEQPIVVNVRPGSTLPLLTSAAGRMFLAYLPRPTTQKLVDCEIETMRSHDPSPNLLDEAGVDALISQVRAIGMSRIEGDLLPGLCAICAPIFNYQNDVVAGLALLARQNGLVDFGEGSSPRILHAVARSISQKLGHDG